MTIWRIPISCCIPKATNTHSEYVILIAFPPQQWSHESAWLLRYTYIVCPLIFITFSSTSTFFQNGLTSRWFSPLKLCVHLFPLPPASVLYNLSGLLCCLYVYMHFSGRTTTAALHKCETCSGTPKFLPNLLPPSLEYFLKMEPVDSTKLWFANLHDVRVLKTIMLKPTSYIN